MKVQNKVLIALAMVMALVWFIPLYWVTFTAFTEPTYRMTLLPTTGFTFSNFKYVMETVPFMQYLLNTIILVVGTFSIQFVTATMGGFALAAYNFRGQVIMYIIIFMQLIVPNDVLIIPNYLTISEFGLIDTKWAIMLPFMGSGMAMFLLRQHFKAIPKALAEAAELDGCSTLGTIWNVYIPNAKNAYLAFGLVSVSYHWNNYLWPLIVTNSVGNRPLTVGLAVFAKASETNMQWSHVCAAAFFISAPLVILFLIFQEKFVNSFASSGIK